MSQILFVGKAADPHCELAKSFLTLNAPDSVIVTARRGDSLPIEVEQWSGEYIISYLSPFIIPKSVLSRAKIAAINFHPGPPNYPGIGCTNFAVYNGESEYGITCHHMLPKVDTGAIVDVKRFPVYPGDSVYSITQRCYVYILTTFYEMMDYIFTGKDLPNSDEAWRRKPYKRSELDDLCRLTLDMTAEEIDRRVRAVTYPNAPGAYLNLHGHCFSKDESNR